jgi:hypothetical protein
MSHQGNIIKGTANYGTAAAKSVISPASEAMKVVDGQSGQSLTNKG